MIRQLKTCVYIILAGTLMCTPAYAEKTKAELIQEALLDGKEPKQATADIIAGDTESTSSEPSTAEQILDNNGGVDISGYDANIPASQIDARIQNLDPKMPDETEVRSLRASFDALTIADKLTIRNIAALEAAEETIRLSQLESKPEPEKKSEPSKVEESPTRFIGQDFSFNINAKEPTLSIIARFTTDDNNDGIGDTPTFTLSGPSGININITTQTKALEDETMVIGCTWTSNFFQMDIAKLIDGGWTLTSTVPVTFEKSPYLGASIILPENTSLDTPTSPQPEIKRDYGPVIKLALTLVALVAGIAVFLFLIKWFFSPDRKEKGSNFQLPKPSSGKKKEEKKAEEEITAKSDDEIIAELKREFEEQQRLEEEMSREAEAEIREAKEEHTDNRLDMTVQDDDDAPIGETFVEHVGDTGVLAEKRKQFNSRFS